MTTYYSREISFYRITAFGLGILILLVSLAGSIGIIWMRQKTARSAIETARLERMYAEEGQQAARLSAYIAQAENPEVLLAQAPKELRPTTEAQVVWLPEPARSSRVVAGNAAQVSATSPLSLSFDLALINNHRKTEY
jgi:hypothetical protein